MSDALRLFLAAWPEADGAAALQALARRATAGGAGRPVAGDRLHLTLAFLGDVAPARLPALARLAAAWQAPPIDLSLDALDWWPRPRVLVARPTVVPAALEAAVAALWAGLAGLGLPPDHEAWRPHVTLARAVARAPAGLGPLAAAVRWRSGEATLVHSARDDGRSVYRVLGRWPLGPGGAGGVRGPVAGPPAAGDGVIC